MITVQRWPVIHSHLWTITVEWKTAFLFLTEQTVSQDKSDLRNWKHEKSIQKATEGAPSFTTDELPGYLDRKCTESFTASSNCAWNSQLTWGRGRWPCGSWPHLRCHSDPWRAWLRRWGPDEAFQPHRRWTESEGSAAPCLELLLSADPGFQAKNKQKT